MERVTKTYLLTNAPCESATSQVLESEEVQTLLAAYVETPAKRRQRVKKMLYGESDISPTDAPYDDEETYSNLADSASSTSLRKGDDAKINR